MNKTVRTVLIGTGGLIALYLGLVYSGSLKTDINAASGAYTSGVRTLQGR